MKRRGRVRRRKKRLKRKRRKRRKGREREEREAENEGVGRVDDLAVLRRERRERRGGPGGGGGGGGEGSGFAFSAVGGDSHLPRLISVEGMPVIPERVCSTAHLERLLTEVTHSLPTDLSKAQLINREGGGLGLGHDGGLEERDNRSIITGVWVWRILKVAQRSSRWCDNKAS